MTGRPGAALVTAGPGFTNALSAVANARMANSPLVLVSGCVGLESAEKLDLQDMRQLPVIEPMVKKALVCHRAERIGEFVDLAFRTAACGRPGPVYLELPVDVLKAEVEDSKVKRLRTAVDSRPVDADRAGAALDMILDARRPMIIAGSGAWYSGAAEELTALVERTGLPVFTLSAGRGVVPDTHARCFESALAIRPGAALFANMSADLFILLGTRVSLYFAFGDLFPAEARMIQVDIEPEEIGRNRAVDLPVAGDVRGFLKALGQEIEARGAGDRIRSALAPWLEALGEAERNSKAQAEPRWSSDQVPIHPQRLAREVDRFMDREGDIVVADGGDTQIWSGMTRTVRRPGRYLDSGLYGCLGVGLPYANAAQLKHPDQRVCLLTGDGSIGFNFMEFETAVRRQLPIVAVIGNDLGWGMIRHSQELSLGRAIERGSYIGRVDYHKLVEALGGVGLAVETPRDIRPAIEEAFASGRTACVNVMTDPAAVSPGSVALAGLGANRA